MSLFRACFCWDALVIGPLPIRRFISKANQTLLGLDTASLRSLSGGGLLRRRHNNC